MISMLQPLPVGNAVRVFLVPPAGAKAVRVLRRAADTFTGADDAGAFMVAETLDHVVVDTVGIVNGVAYWYKAYALVGGVWVAGESRSATPNAIYQDESTDVVSILRERLSAGLLVELQRGTLTHELGKIPVLIASPTFEGTKWPVVTIHVGNDGDEMRWIGETDIPDWFDADADEWVGNEGWLGRVQLNVTGWSINSDERKTLRQAIKRIVIGNLPVFDAQGLSEVSIKQQDVDDFQSYSAPVYLSSSQFSCLARSAVSSVEGPIRTVVVTPVAPAAPTP